MSTTRRQFLQRAACGAAVVAGVQRPLGFAGTVAGEERAVDGIRVCWCPPGRFLMGSPASEAGRRATENQVAVTLTKGFFAGKFEVTQGEWRRVVGAFPERQPSERFGLGDDMPAYWISFDDAERFVEAATTRARAAGALPVAWRFALPTEAQWEYACRAGTTGATAFGGALDVTRANFSVNPTDRAVDAVGSSRRVGSYPANAWGLHDMHGNVWEWCRDWFHAEHVGGVDPDRSKTPGVPNRDGSYSRVRRGGAWIEEAALCRSAARLPYEPNRGSDHIGFRVIVQEG